MAKDLRFYLVTDTHYFENSLGASGEKYDEYMKTEQMCLAENQAICRAVFSKIAQDKTTDIVIMPGDLTKDGEKESHKALIADLYKLKQAGKRVYVITARHDFNEHPRAYCGNEYVPVEGTSREELFDLYYDFGYSEAIAIDRESMSYVVQLDENTRLLAINSDGTAERKGYIDDRLMAWLGEQIARAKKDNCYMFAINHYPIIPSVPIFSILGDAKVKQWRTVASFLADSGINLIFTGHMHIQSINQYTSEQGNRLWDVCTSALVGAPAKFRHVSLSEGRSARIRSVSVPSFDWDMQGLTVEQYFNRQFGSMVGNKFNKIINYGSKDAKPILKLVGRIANNLTVGGVGRLLCLSADASVKKEKLFDFASVIVMNVFAGDPPYSKETAVYQDIELALKRLKPIVKKLEKKLKDDGRPIDLKAIILGSICSDKPYSDNDAELKL